MIGRIREKIKNHFHEVIKLKKSPHSIAIGFALGTFIVILPTPGFSVLIGLLVILIFKKINKFSLFGAMAVWNPIVLTPVYYLSYKIGDLILGSRPVVESEMTILNTVIHITRRFLVGNVILAILISILSYFIVRKIVVFVRKTKYIKL